ncbi:MAG: CHASE3 domain-containing protein, partial [Candidatus Acidiferrales bacterium]
MSLKNKTNVAFFAALITLAVIGWFSIQRNRTTEEMDRLVSKSRDILAASEMLRSHVYDTAASRRAYTLWGDQTQLDAFQLAYQSTLSDYTTLLRLAGDNPEQQSRMTKLGQLIDARLSLLKQSVELHQRTRDDEKQQAVFNDESTRLSTQITELIDAFNQTEGERLNQRKLLEQASFRRKTTVNAILGLSVFLFLILTLALLNRELTSREQAERAAAEQKELFQSILDSSSDAVIVADTTGRIILRNPEGTRYNASASTDYLDEKYPELLGLYRNDRQTLFKKEDLPLNRALAGESVNGLE